MYIGSERMLAERTIPIGKQIGWIGNENAFIFWLVNIQKDWSILIWRTKQDMVVLQIRLQIDTFHDSVYFTLFSSVRTCRHY